MMPGRSVNLTWVGSTCSIDGRPGRAPLPGVARRIVDQLGVDRPHDVAFRLRLAVRRVEHLQIGIGAHPQHARVLRAAETRARPPRRARAQRCPAAGCGGKDDTTACRCLLVSLPPASARRRAWLVADASIAAHRRPADLPAPARLYTRSRGTLRSQVREKTRRSPSNASMRRGDLERVAGAGHHRAGRGADPPGAARAASRSRRSRPGPRSDRRPDRVALDRGLADLEVDRVEPVDALVVGDRGRGDAAQRIALDLALAAARQQHGAPPGRRRLGLRERPQLGVLGARRPDRQGERARAGVERQASPARARARAVGQ